MKPERTRRVIGGSAALLGLWCTFGVIFPPVRRLCVEGIVTFDILSFLAILPMMLIPGILALVFGISLFREMSESSLKWSVGSSAVLLVFYLSYRSSLMFPSLFPPKIMVPTLILISSFIVIIAYLFVGRLLLLYLNGKAPSTLSLVSRGVMALMAWQLWMLLSSLFEVFLPIEKEYAHGAIVPWGILGLVIPIIVAYGVYRIIITKLDTLQQAELEQPRSTIQFR